MATEKKSKRKKLFLLLAMVLVAVALAWGVYWHLFLSHTVSTDNAYVGAEIAQLTAFTNGIVKDITVVDTQAVKEGDLLVTLDDTDAQLELARTEAEVQWAQANLDKAISDLDRRKKLSTSGSVSEEELTNAENSFNTAQAIYNAARSHYAQSKINATRTRVYSPIDGIVARRQIQLGQRITSGMVLMSIVPLQNLHVDANFKEVQLEHVKTGQVATLTSDLYGSGVVYHGRVVGFAGGTGAAFSIIPAQNATGNWIKVVQRLPVRIAIDPQELADHPLRVGLSMTAVIDISSGLKK